MSVYSLAAETVLVQEHIGAAQFIEETTALFSEIVFIYEPEIKKLRYNLEQVATTLGYSPDVLSNNDIFNILDIVHEEDVVTFNNALDDVYAEQDFTCRLQCTDGTYEAYQCRKKIVSGPTSQRVIISARHTAATPFLSHHAELNSTINDLRQSNKELEEFAYVASHDLQEPLRKITTFSSMMAEKYGTVLQKDGNMYLNRIMASANNMRMFIDSLLDFSHISRLEQSFITTDLNTTLRQVMADMDMVIDETGTLIECNSLPVIHAVPMHMKQLFTNIISNSIKFRKEGVLPLINISCHVMPEEEKRALALPGAVTYHKIELCDNGIGFDMEYASRIFQVFQRLHGKSDYPGSGIGLAICKKIMEAHGGAIYAENNPASRGAKFILILPERHY